MKRHRPERVGGLIQEELGKLLLREVETQGELLTITSVEVDKKLEHAIVYVSVLVPEGKDAERRAEKALKALQAREPYLQALLYRILNIRPMPKIAFRRDRGPERAASVEKALMSE